MILNSKKFMWLWKAKCRQMRTSQFMAQFDWLSAKCKQNPAIWLANFQKRLLHHFRIFRSLSKNGRGDAVLIQIRQIVMV